MNIHELIDRLEAWVNRGDARGARAYYIIVHTDFPHRTIFIHPRSGICLKLNEHDNLLRLL